MWRWTRTNAWTRANAWTLVHWLLNPNCHLIRWGPWLPRDNCQLNCLLPRLGRGFEYRTNRELPTCWWLTMLQFWITHPRWKSSGSLHWWLRSSARLWGCHGSFLQFWWSMHLIDLDFRGLHHRRIPYKQNSHCFSWRWDGRKSGLLRQCRWWGFSTCCLPSRASWPVCNYLVWCCHAWLSHWCFQPALSWLPQRCEEWSWGSKPEIQPGTRR